MTYPRANWLLKHMHLEGHRETQSALIDIVNALFGKNENETASSRPAANDTSSGVPLATIIDTVGAHLMQKGWTPPPGWQPPQVKRPA